MVGQRGAAHRVRIIGGVWKRSPLEVIEAPGLRPTPDRVRETLFNWLGRSLEGSVCLDLFGGTGALGLESASRGASRVVIVESHRQAAQSIAQSIARLRATQVELLRREALPALEDLQRAGLRFDLVFLDPPFGQAWIERVLPVLPEVLAQEALVYCECEGKMPAWPAGYEVLRAARAGQVHYHLLRFQRTDSPPA